MASEGMLFFLMIDHLTSSVLSLETASKEISKKPILYIVPTEWMERVIRRVIYFPDGDKSPH